MDNNQNKSINSDNYDLILEEKEKELKKEKRNKRILATSLALLLLLGSTAVVAPIISVAVNNKNNSLNIPNILTFTNEDITKLINGYKSEIQARKLSFEQFQNDFENITKKYIVASNIKIGTIVQSAKITQNVNTKDFNIEIVLNENKEYLTNTELTLATLNKNVLTITLKENEKLLGEFFTPTDPINSDKLNKLPEQIQDVINTNKWTEQDIEKLKEIIANHLGVNKDLIGDIKYEHPKLIIEPKPPYTFVSDSNNNLIVDGNIEISNIKFYKLIKFINLDKLFNKLNELINSIKGSQTTAEDFKKYLENNSINSTVYDNLESVNKSDFNKSDILNIQLNDANELVINLNDNYLKYEIDQNTNNFVLNNNQLIVQNLSFFYNVSPESWFIFGNNNTQKDWLLSLSDEGAKQKHIIFPSYIKTIFQDLFQNNENIVSVDMSLIDFEGTSNGRIPMSQPNSLRFYLFKNAINLTTVIFPKSGLDSIYSENFQYCSSLRYVKFFTRMSPVSKNIFQYARNKVIIYVPNEELKIYYENLNLSNVEKVEIGTPPRS